MKQRRPSSLSLLACLASSLSLVSCTIVDDDVVADDGDTGDTGGTAQAVELPDSDKGNSPTADLSRRPRPQASFPPCDDSIDCCPAGYERIEGTSGDDNLDGIFQVPSCLVGFAGEDDLDGSNEGDVLLGGPDADDIDGGFGKDIVLGGDGDDDIRTIHDEDEIDAGPGDDQIDGGFDNDIIFGRDGIDDIDGGSGDDWISAGPGDDVVEGGFDADYIEGNAGDDEIEGGIGDDTIIPGPGRDEVDGEIGDDTVIIYDVCELESGEVLDGGFAGNDTLVIPIEEEEALAIGVVIEDFETVIVDDSQTGESECKACGCELVGGQIECCSGNGECVESASPGDYECECDAGFEGGVCQITPESAEIIQQAKTISEANRIANPPTILTANCGGDAEGFSTFRAPSTAGNGLVYNAFAPPSIVADLSNTNNVVAATIDFQARTGYRPVQLDIKPSQVPGALVLSPQVSSLSLLADEDSNYEIETVLALSQDDFIEDFQDRDQEGGWRILTATQHVVDAFDPTVDAQRYSAIWIRDGRFTSAEWTLQFNLTQHNRDTQLDNFASAGFRPIAIEGTSFLSQTFPFFEWDPLFSMVMVADEIGAAGDWRVSFDVLPDDVLDEIATQQSDGFEPSYIAGYVADVGPATLPRPIPPDAYNIIFIRRPEFTNGDLALNVQVTHGATATTLALENDLFRSNGFNLVSLTSLPDRDTQQPLYSAIWHRYEIPDSDNAQDVRFEGSYTAGAGEPFLFLEPAVLNPMIQNNIPAAQIAVAQGDEIVYSRAITRAPAAYPAITPATPMNVASIAKPMTAVAALQTVGSLGIFSDLMSLVPAPTIGTKPTGITVQQTLQHSGGWSPLDGPSIFATRNMMTALGRSDAPTAGDFLDFMASQPGNGLGATTFNYSNFGFEMLRLMVQTQNGLPTPPNNPVEIVDYEGFMQGSVFGPAGMCETSYKRQGLFDGAPEPHYAGCTGNCAFTDNYLIEAQHPYNGNPTRPLPPLVGMVRYGPSGYDTAASAPDELRHGIYGGNTALTSSLASGSLVTTAEDLVRFLVSFRPFFLSGSDTPLLSAGEAALMFPGFGLNVFGPAPANGQFPCPPGAVATGLGTVMSCYGLGWFMGNDTDGTSDASTLVWHGGNAWGTTSFVLYHPESDVTVSVIFARDYVSGGVSARNVADPLLDLIAAGLPILDEDLAKSLAPGPGGVDDGIGGTYRHP